MMIFLKITLACASVKNFIIGQNQGSHNFLTNTNGPILKQKTLIKSFEKSKKLIFMLLSRKTRALSNWPPKLRNFYSGIDQYFTYHCIEKLCLTVMSTYFGRW